MSVLIFKANISSKIKHVKVIRDTFFHPSARVALRNVKLSVRRSG